MDPNPFYCMILTKMYNFNSLMMLFPTILSKKYDSLEQMGVYCIKGTCFASLRGRTYFTLIFWTQNEKIQAQVQNIKPPIVFLGNESIIIFHYFSFYITFLRQLFGATGPWSSFWSWLKFDQLMHGGGGKEGVENGFGDRPWSLLTGKKGIIHFVRIGTELQPIY